MGFGKAQNLRKKSEKQREVHETRKQHQGKSYWKSKRPRASSLTQSHGFSPLKESASGGNTGRAKRENLLISRVAKYTARQYKQTVKWKEDYYTSPKRRKPPSGSSPKKELQKSNYSSKGFGTEFTKRSKNLTHMDKMEVLRALVSEKKPASLKMYKIVGVITRSIKAVHTALLEFFALPKMKVGGITFFEKMEAGCSLQTQKTLQDRQLSHSTHWE